MKSHGQQRRTYYETYHLSLPLDEIPQRAENILPKNEPIVVYSGTFISSESIMAAEKLESMGYDDIADFRGGMQDYKLGKQPVESILR